MSAIKTIGEFESRISPGLNGTLPGRNAHLKMAASHYRNWPEPGEHVRNSAVLMLFYPVNEGISFPVILRPSYEGVHSGQISFPGGKAEPEDLNLIETALREAKEEVDAPIEQVRILGKLSEIFITVSNLRVVPVIGTLPFKPVLTPDPREVREIREVSLKEILDKQVVRQGRMPVRGGYVAAPYYDYQGLQIWGATAMMISELAEIIDS